MTVNEILGFNATKTSSFNDKSDIYPMKYGEFMQLSDEEKKNYLEELRSQWNATDEMIGRMMGVSSVVITKNSNRLCAEARNPKESNEKKAFFDWVDGKRADFGGNMFTEQQIGDQKDDFSEKEEENGQTSGKLRVFASLGDISAMLQAMAMRDSQKYAVSVSWDSKFADE